MTETETTIRIAAPFVVSFAVFAYMSMREARRARQGHPTLLSPRVATATSVFIVAAAIAWMPFLAQIAQGLAGTLAE